MALSYNGSFNLGNSTFAPKNEFMSVLRDSDVSLIFLSAEGILYTGEVNDDWYAAHRVAFNSTSASSANLPHGSVQVYLSDEPASVIGCKSHYQVCSPTSPPGKDCFLSGGYWDLSNPTLSKANDASSLIPWVTSDTRTLRMSFLQ